MRNSPLIMSAVATSLARASQATKERLPRSPSINRSVSMSQRIVFFILQTCELLLDGCGSFRIGHLAMKQCSSLLPAHKATIRHQSGNDPAMFYYLDALSMLN